MSADAAGGVVRLGGVVLDLGRGTLSRDGRLLPLRSKSFRLLCELARNAGRVVPKQELLDAVWPDAAVTEDSLSQAIHDIRRALGAADAQLLRTVARRGFLLALAQDPAARSPASPGRPRIAILPPADRTGDPSLAPLLDGFAEEITGGLSRFRNLTVLARHSAFALAREGLPLSEIAARLGADHLVDGTARMANGRLRLSLALNEAATGEVLWTDALEPGASGWFDLRDLVVQRIVLRLFASVEEAGLRRGLRRPEGDLTAFEHLARGKALFRSFEPGVNERAAAHFRAALEADPAFGIAHSYLGLAELALHDFGLAPPEVKRRSAGRAAQGVELSPDESRCHGILAYMLTLLGEVSAAEREARLAIELNPCDPDGPFELALVLAWSGRSAEALPWIERAKDMNPLWPAYYDTLHSEALLFVGRPAESAALLRRLPRLSARQQMRLAATLALAGEDAEARRHAQAAVEASPGADWLGMVDRAYAGRHGPDVDLLARGIERALALLAPRRDSA